MDDLEPSFEQWVAYIKPRFVAHQAKLKAEGGDWTQEKIGNNLGLGQSTVSKFLNNGYKADSEIEFFFVLKALCNKLLNIKITDDLRRRIKFARYHGYVSGIDCLGFGGTQTLFYATVGQSRKGEALSIDHVSVEYLPRQLILPDTEIDAAVERTRKEWNAGLRPKPKQLDELLTLLSPDVNEVFTLPDDGREVPGLTLSFGLSNYAIFFTLRSTEHGLDILQRRLRVWTRDMIVPPQLSQGVGVNICVVTGDDKVVIGTRKRDKPGPRPGELEVGACEGLRIADVTGSGIAESSSGLLDTRKLFFRALEEELGLSADDVSDLQLTNFGYDLQYGQWNLIGYAQTPLTLEQIHSDRHSSRARDKYEIRLHETPSGTRALFKWIAEQPNPLWSCGLACLYFGLTYRDGPDAVCEASRGLNLFRFK